MNTQARPVVPGRVGPAAVAVEPPAMKRAFDLAPPHPPAPAQVDVAMGARRVLHVGDPGRVAPHHELLPAGLGRLGLPRVNLVGTSDRYPDAVDILVPVVPAHL